MANKNAFVYVVAMEGSGVNNNFLRALHNRCAARSEGSAVRNLESAAVFQGLVSVESAELHKPISAVKSGFLAHLCASYLIGPRKKILEEVLEQRLAIERHYIVRKSLINLKCCLIFMFTTYYRKVAKLFKVFLKR